MKQILLSLSFIAACFSLNSCSGPPGGNTCTTGCTGGNANLTLTVLDTPPTGATFLNFNTPIVGITMTSSTGTIVNVFSPTTPVFSISSACKATLLYLAHFKFPLTLTKR